MGAYAALLSLSQTLDETLLGEEHPLLFSKQDLLSLHQNVSTLLSSLHDFSSKFTPPAAVKPLQSRIVDAAYHAEDLILASPFPRPRRSVSRIRNLTVFGKPLFSPKPRNHLDAQPGDLLSFPDVVHEIDSILIELSKIKNADLSENESDYQNSSTSTLNDVNVGVFEDEFAEIQNWVREESSSDLQCMSLVGMGGVGKSTLARRLYEDAIMEQVFERFIWIVVSHGYSLREILIGILRPYQKEVDEKSENKKPLEECDDRELKLLLHKELYGRSYLVVLDDVWSLEAWDELNQLFPRDTMGSRILVTTRSFNIAASVGLQHEISPLSADQSWRLLKENIFTDGSCPSQLEQIGKQIAVNCRGLPLTIVVVAGLLKGNIEKQYWGSISHNIGSAEPTIQDHCSKVLALSYEHLPLYLKPCFLYVSALPEDAEIAVDRMITLWMAEGLIKPSGSKCLEEVAMGYLDDLVSRSLLITSKKVRYNNRIETFVIHDLLREFALKAAEEERFFYCMSTEYNGYKQRRFSFTNTNSLSNFIAGEDKLKGQRNPVVIRSLLVFCHSDAYKQQFGKTSYPNNFTFLRVWDTLKLPNSCNPIPFVHLRYLAVEHKFLSSSISNLLNLQTLIVHHSEYMEQLVSIRYWRMPSLRHVIIPDECYLEAPGENEILVATNLQTLPEVRDLKITTEVIQMFGNLRKLYLRYTRIVPLCIYGLNNLIHLKKLEELRITFAVDYCLVQDFQLSFPSSLRSLYLRSTAVSKLRSLDRVHDSLPDVEELELDGRIFRDGVWNPVEGQFSKLKVLKLNKVHLSNWLADSNTFPSLEVLVLYEMPNIYTNGMEEIPSGMGEIDTLERIELHNCKSSLEESARKIQDDKLEMGHDLEVRVIGRKKGK